MLMRTWLVSGQTWGAGVGRDSYRECHQDQGRPWTALPDTWTHLQDDNVIVAKGAELVTPSGVMADHLVDDISRNYLLREALKCTSCLKARIVLVLP